MDQHPQSLRLTKGFDEATTGTAASSEALPLSKALPSRSESTAAVPSTMSDAELRNQIYSAALDRYAHGVVIVDAGGKLMLCNAAARAILDAGHGLKLVQARVTATLANESRRLHALLANALEGCAAHAEAMVVHGPAPSAYAVTMESIGDMLRQRTGAAAMLYITNLKARPSHYGEAKLRAMFGFTPAETRIAVGLADGDSVHTVAASVGVTYESARFTLKRVYEKLGVHKQGELVALLRSALPPLREA